MKNNWQKSEDILMRNGVVILPTDTLYGIVGRAESKKAINRIYKIKGRDENKPFIVLITSYKDLKKFDVNIDMAQAKFLKKIWPGQVSAILPCKLVKYNYLHRGVKAIAFRMIGKKNLNLFKLINKVGPLVAPSANRQGEKSVGSITEAEKYFGEEVDLYIDGGMKKSVPSTLIKYENKNWVVLRQGKVKI